MIKIQVFKFIFNYKEILLGYEEDSIQGFSKEEIYEKIFENFHKVDPNEITSIPDLVSSSFVETYPEKDIPHWNDFIYYQVNHKQGTLFASTKESSDKEDISVFRYNLATSRWEEC